MPPLSEATAEYDLNQMLQADWEPLLALRPRIAESAGFASTSVGSPWPEWTEVVQDFYQTVHAIPVVISFDWPPWDAGRAALGNPDHDFTNETLVDLCKMITTIVRAERFTEGFLPLKFSDGTILRISPRSNTT